MISVMIRPAEMATRMCTPSDFISTRKARKTQLPRDAKLIQKPKSTGMVRIASTNAISGATVYVLPESEPGKIGENTRRTTRWPKEKLQFASSCLLSISVRDSSPAACFFRCISSSYHTTRPPIRTLAAASSATCSFVRTPACTRHPPVDGGGITSQFPLSQTAITDLRSCFQCLDNRRSFSLTVDRERA